MFFRAPLSVTLIWNPGLCATENLDYNATPHPHCKINNHSAFSRDNRLVGKDLVIAFCIVQMDVCT